MAVTSLVCTAALLSLVGAVGPPVLPLPPYIKRACSRNDPNINECVVEVGAPAIKAVANGDPKYKIPKLDPLLIEELVVKQGSKSVGLALHCRKCLLWGIHKAVFYKAEVDWKNRRCLWYIKMDKMKITGNYDVSGQVLLLPIVGKGEADFNLENVTCVYNYTWNYVTKKNGRQYVNITDGVFNFDVEHMRLRLENLFNGDKFLGENMNHFLNEHWADILNDIKPALSTAFGSLAVQVFSNMASVVPFDLMFPEKYTPPPKKT